MRYLLIAMLAALPAPAGAADQLDFKGVPFGASEQDFIARHAAFRCRDIEPRFRIAGDRACSVFGKPERPHDGAKHEAGTYAGVPANVFASFYGDRLASVSVTIFAARFDEVLKALVERHGKPDAVESSVIKTPAGAELQNAKSQWKR